MIPRQRTVTDVDRDLKREVWLRNLAVTRYDGQAAVEHQTELDRLLDERLRLTAQAAT